MEFCLGLITFSKVESRYRDRYSDLSTDCGIAGSSKRSIRLEFLYMYREL